MKKFIKVEVTKGNRHLRNSFNDCDPYAVAHVYFPPRRILKEGKVVRIDAKMITGWATEVENYIQEYLNPSIYRITYYNNGRTRGFYCTTIKDLLITKHDFSLDGVPKVRFHFFFKGKKLLSLKRVPKKWINEYYQFLTN